MTQETGQCAGCGATIEGSYCSVCGQRRVGRITFRRVFSQAASNLTIDSAFLRTLIGMTTHPGRVAREYVEGRRKAYMNPLKYTFVIATVFALEVNLLEILPPGIDADREAAVSQFRTIIAALAYLAYVHMLPTAALQRQLFRRQPIGIAECYVFLVFAYGQFVLIGALFALFGLYSTAYGNVAIGLFGLGYFMWATAGFYGDFKPLTLLKGALVYAVYLFLSVGSGFLLILAMSIYARL